MESLDCPVTLAGKDLRAPTASLDLRERTARRERGESPAKQALEDSEARRVHEEVVAPEDQQESQVQRAPQAMMDLLARQERGVLKDLRDPLASPDLKDPMALQEKMGCPVIPDRGERRASKERPDLQDLEGWLDHRARLERPDLEESGDTRVLLVLLVSKVCPELLGKRVERAIQALRVLVASQDLLASGASRGREVFQGPWVQLA